MLPAKSASRPQEHSGHGLINPILQKPKVWISISYPTENFMSMKSIWRLALNTGKPLPACASILCPQVIQATTSGSDQYRSNGDLAKIYRGVSAMRTHRHGMSCEPSDRWRHGQIPFRGQPFQVKQTSPAAQTRLPANGVTLVEGIGQA